MYRIPRQFWIAAAVVLAFVVTYLAFAPEPFGSRGGTLTPAIAMSDVQAAQVPPAPAAAESESGGGTDVATVPNTTTDTNGDQPDRAGVGAAREPDFAPQDGVNHWQRGRQLFWQRDYAAAAVELERATRQRPGRYYPHYLLGLCYHRLGDDALAEREYIAAREIDGEKPEALVNLARLYLAVDLPEEALELTLQATEVTPDYDAGWNVRGRAHLALNEHAAAIAAFEEACRLNADNAYAWNNLGYALLQGGEFAAALDPLATAVGLRGDIAYMHNNLGVVLEQLGRTEEAYDAFVEAAELDPTHAEASASADRLAEILAARPAPPASPTEAAADVAAATTTLD
jgi:Flp pilus assembly protein TadD